MRKWMKIVLPVLLMALVIAVLAYALNDWKPHGGYQIEAEFMGCISGIYAIVAGIRRVKERNWLGLTLCILLLLVCCGAFWIANQIPFCPECDGADYYVSPLMERLMGDRLPDISGLNLNG